MIEPAALHALRDAATAAHEAVFALRPEHPPTAFTAVAAQLAALHKQASALARPACPHKHPPVDPNPDEYGDCLLCNTTRRRAQRPSSARITAITRTP